MPDVEFLVPSEPDGDDETLDAGRRPVPRWVVLVGVLVLAAVVAIVVVRGRHTPIAAPAVVPPPATPLEQVAPNLPLPDAYDLVGDTPDHKLFALSGTQLFATGSDGLPDGGAVAVEVGAESDVQIELVLDAAHGVLWAVPQNATGHAGLAAGLAEAFSSRSLGVVGRIPLPGRVESAAVLGSDLYVSTDAGLFRTSTLGPAFVQVGGARVADAQLVADPSRGRLICVVPGGTRPSAVIFRPGSSLSAGLPLAGGELAVVGRTIWLAGSDARGGLLMTLNSRTLRPVRVVAGLGAVEIQGTGARSLYVSVGEQLRCVDGTSGQLLHSFGRLSGSFATVGRRGFVGSVQALHPVAMGACPG